MVRRPARLSGLLILLAGIISASTARSENWPTWRGVRGDGVSGEKDLPIAWNEQASMVWKTPLPGWGCSTPIIWEDAVFVTSQQDDQLLLLRIDRRDGQIVWKQAVGTGSTPREPQLGEAGFHRLHNLASPSPVTDGEVVITHFGNGLLAAYDFDGKRLWDRNLQRDHSPYSIRWGHANSPLIAGAAVVSVCMQRPLADDAQPRAESYVVAHDLATGREQWFARRPCSATAKACDAYTTPVLRETGEQQEVVVMGANLLDAYDPATGERIWWLPNVVGGRTVASPTVAGGLIYATEGERGDLLAVQPAQGRELDRRDVKWKYRHGTPDTCSPVVWADLLFALADDGIVRCIDAGSGHLRWKHRLKGDYKASPVAAQGRIYFLNTKGLCTVISASTRFDKLTENQLEDRTLASPAVSGGQIFIRGREHLYCIGN